MVAENLTWRLFAATSSQYWARYKQVDLPATRLLLQPLYYLDWKRSSGWFESWEWLQLTIWSFSGLQSPRWYFSIKVCYSWVQTIFLLMYILVSLWLAFVNNPTSSCSFHTLSILISASRGPGIGQPQGHPEEFVNIFLKM